MQQAPIRRFSTSVMIPEGDEFKVEHFFQCGLPLAEAEKKLKRLQDHKRRSSLLPSTQGDTTRSKESPVQAKKLLESRGGVKGKGQKLMTQTSLPTLPRCRKYLINIIEAEEKLHPSPFSSSPQTIHRSSSAIPSPDASPGHSSDKHLFSTFQALDEVRKLHPPPEALLKLYRIPLPSPRKPFTVVFDLEDTLVRFCDRHSPGAIFLSAHGSAFALRPHALRCLRELREDWEIILFASSLKAKCESVVNCIDPQSTVVDFRLFQESCVPVDNCYVKDLRILAGRDLKRTVIVDNNPTNFAFQLDNGIAIKSWKGSEKDNELLRLTEFLRELRRYKDVRERLRGVFDLQHFCEDFEKAFRKRARKPSM